MKVTVSGCTSFTSHVHGIRYLYCEEKCIDSRSNRILLKNSNFSFDSPIWKNGKIQSIYFYGIFLHCIKTDSDVIISADVEIFGLIYGIHQNMALDESDLA